MKKCCQKTLFREGAKFCSQCGKRLHMSFYEKETLFFKVSNIFGDMVHQSIDFIEDYDKYGDAALNWHGLDSIRIDWK